MRLKTNTIETARLHTRRLKNTDADQFFKMMSNPNVMDPIPQAIFSRKQSDEKLLELMVNDPEAAIRIYAVLEKQKDELIGIAGYLKNDEEDEEIAYRLLEKYWGRGYGIEIAKGLIDHAFMNSEILRITADVNIENTKSTKILNKFFTPVRDFYNSKDHCTDRRYVLTRKEWENWKK